MELFKRKGLIIKMYAFAARRKQRAASERSFMLLKEREREKERWGRERKEEEEGKKKEKLEIEHIFVTYLPIGWVQTNKMEKVKVIP